MGGEAAKLLADARRSKAGWNRTKLDSLYLGFGFIIKNSRGPHDKVYHPDHPELFTWLPRHTKLGEYNIDNAIKLIDRLQQLKEKQHG
ncbi:MAG: hypothetical protein WBV22_08875 [Anaerolineaceae bacterium]